MLWPGQPAHPEVVVKEYTFPGQLKLFDEIDGQRHNYGAGVPVLEELRPLRIVREDKGSPVFIHCCWSPSDPVEVSSLTLR